MKNILVGSALVGSLVACGSVPAVDGTDDKTQARLVSVEDGGTPGPVDVRITRACVTRSARIHTAQDGNYYTYTLDIDVENSSTNGGEFEIRHQGFLNDTAPLPITEVAYISPLSIDASTTQTVSDSLDAQVPFLNYWSIGVRTLHAKFPAYTVQKIILPQDLNDTEIEISHCTDF